MNLSIYASLNKWVYFNLVPNIFLKKKVYLLVSSEIVLVQDLFEFRALNQKQPAAAAENSPKTFQ